MIIGNRKSEIDNPKDTQPIEIEVDPNSVIRSTELISGLKSIADRYSTELRKQANAYADLQVGDSSADSDEALLQRAKETLDEIYGAKRDKKTNAFSDSSDALNEQKRTLGVDRALALEKVGDRYRVKEDTLSENMSKRGLTHSSVDPLAREALGEERNKELARVNYTYDKRIDTVDRKIERLTSSYEDALKNYEISYAIGLEKEIARLKSKRDRLADEYAKEHADDRQKAYDEYMTKERKANADFEEMQGDYTGLKKDNYTERYNYLVGELKGKSAKSVQNFINNYEYVLKEYLGLYYDAFVKEVT